MSSATAFLPELFYRVQIQPQSSRVTLRVNPGNATGRPLLFFAGQVNVTHLAEERGVRIHRDGRLLRCMVPDNRSFELHYSVQLGRLAKHGHQGYSCKDFVIFGGEQLFIIPASGVARNIRVEFVFPPEMQAVLPKPVLHSAAGKAETAYSDNTWRGVYALMKNNYTFGRFKRLKVDKITVVFPETAFENQPSIMTGVAALETYFSHFFLHAPENYNLTLLPETAGQSVMGGVGPDAVGFSFSPAKKRDWQLLGHRLFHAWYDRAVGVRELHLPGNLWLLEGLASWSELESTAHLPECVTSAWTEQKDESVLGELAALYRRYLYFRFKDPELFSGAPAAERDIQHEGAREFLHYTQAPLIVAALAAQMGEANSWGKWLQELPQTGSDNILPSVLALLPAEKRSDARKWMDSPEVLHLFDLFSDYSEAESGTSEAAILADLQEFEYVLSTWFAASPGLFQQHSIDVKTFTRAAVAAQAHPVNFAAPEIQTQLEKYSPTVFLALQIHFLRLQVCGIVPDDPLRNHKLEQPEALTKWQDFLANLPD